MIQKTRNGGAENRTIKQGETIDLKENVKVEDNTDRVSDVSVIVEVDTNVPGEYEIAYIATDQSNNSSEKENKDYSRSQFKCSSLITMTTIINQQKVKIIHKNDEYTAKQS